MHSSHSGLDQGSDDGRARPLGLDSVGTVGGGAPHTREEGKGGGVEEGAANLGARSIGGDGVAGGRSQGGRSDENQRRTHLGALKDGWISMGESTLADDKNGVV